MHMLLSPSKQILLGSWICSTVLLGVAVSVELIHHRTAESPALSPRASASAMREFRSQKETLPSRPEEVSLVAVGDLTVANIETPIIADAGIDLVSLANNHTMYKGAEGRAAVLRIELIPIEIVNSQPRIVASASNAAHILDPLNLLVEQSHAIMWDNDHRTYTLQASPVYSVTQDAVTSVSSSLEKIFTADADADDDPELYVLSRGTLQITEQRSGASWKSDDAWWIDDVQITDVTGDGVVEVAMSVWRSGNFGSSQPVWVAENDLSVKNHFFLFHWEADTLKPTWHSSNLTMPNCAFVLTDMDADAGAELVVIEGAYTDDASCTGTHVAVWKWNEWGFYNEWRSTAGSFTRLRTERIDGKTAVFVDAR